MCSRLGCLCEDAALKRELATISVDLLASVEPAMVLDEALHASLAFEFLPVLLKGCGMAVWNANMVSLKAKEAHKSNRCCGC